MSIIVTNERRRNRPKAARPFGVALKSPLDFIASLAQATSLRVAPRLASGLPKAITMPPGGRDRLPGT